MRQRSALLAMTAVLGTVIVACHHRARGPGGSSGGGIAGHGGFVSTPIAFAQSTAGCVSLKEDPVKARSDDSVVWAVVAQPACGFEGQTVEVVFSSGDDPGRCYCSDPIRNNNAKLRLKVKRHAEHHSYTYEIRVAGKVIADPRLEVDP